MRAHEKLGFLDNGRDITPIGNFKRYFSFDGTSAPIMARRALCFAANRAVLTKADRQIREMFERNPSLLGRWQKQILNQNKRSDKGLR